MSRAQDILGVLRGIQTVAQEGLKTQRAGWNVIWNNSSVRTAINQASNKTSVKRTEIKDVNQIVSIVTDSADRINAVVTGVREFAKNAPVLQTQSADKGKISLYNVLTYSLARFVLTI